MSLINWEESYSVGIKELDDQHKKMLDLINRFHEAMKSYADDKLRQAVLHELFDYASFHLVTEEKYFEKYQYPGAAEHILVHDFYRQKINEFKNKNDDLSLSYDMIDFLEDWWLGHIAVADKEYQPFFASKGLK